MKSLGALATHYALEVQTTALLLKVTRLDSTVLGFTSHDKDLTYGGVTYSANGFSPTATNTLSSLAVSDLDWQFLIDSTTITESDLVGGKYDYARIDIYRVNWNSLSAADTLFRGRVGQISMRNGQAVAEARSLAQALNEPVGKIIQKDCDADLGDARCGVNLAGITVTGTLTAVTSYMVFTDSSRAEAASYFDYGKLTFTSGLNNGLFMEVKSSASGGVLTMKIGFPYLPAVGDAYSLYPGCDKSSTDCKSTFSNFVNFRGFPHIIGIDAMLRPGGL
jgi:uncharacterized phage protein (TIGR02218 family)